MLRVNRDLNKIYFLRIFVNVEPFRLIANIMDQNTALLLVKTRNYVEI